ncbi:MAG: hypothetical protein L0221_06505 [Chloroflexi bacterium]|nr:hypothetical protein [Chloroflexota bacterium]
MRRILLAVSVAAVVAACAGQAGPAAPPSESEALQHLESVIALVQAGHADRICDFGGPTCSMSIDDADSSQVPQARPVVMSIRTLQPVDHGNGTWSSGGVLIELCGLDGLGKPYQSDMLVYRNRGRVVSTEPAYWLGIQIISEPAVGPAAGPPEACRAR